MTTPQEREQLKIVIVGHVDHGKSTLVGRLFHDTDSLPEGKYEQIKAMCEKRGMPFEWSFLMDALQAERDQGITIDTTQIWFKTEKRDYCIIDAPGHKEFLKNMISGAANSEAALLIIDANEGVKEQSKRHGYLLHLLGVNQIAVAVNKMDMVDYSEETFNNIETEYRNYLKGIGVTPTYIIPISAREGDNIVNNSDKMNWYQGPTIVEALDHFNKKPKPVELPLRLPVQDVYKFDERRIIVGRIESGTVNVGDEIIFSPTNRKVKVASIEDLNPENAPSQSSAGHSVGITLNEQIFVERGQVATHTDNLPILSNTFKAKLFWLGDNPITVGKRYKLKITTGEWQVEVKSIDQVVDTDNLSHSSSEKVEKNAVAEITLRMRGLAPLDAFETNAIMGRFVLIEDYHIVGGGIIDLNDIKDQRGRTDIKSENIKAVDTEITKEQRAYFNGHLGGILWFSGLSGAGKTTLATELQKRLFEKGYHVYVLDGDNIRGGLNRDLGFSPEDRSENIRRVAETAALFADAGIIVITAFITPYQKDRHAARAAAPNDFHSIYVKADLETCEKRDVKGLYEKARKGEIQDFTGVSAPFEEPEDPDVTINTTKLSIEESLEELLTYVDENLVKPAANIGQDKTSTYSGGAI